MYRSRDMWKVAALVGALAMTPAPASAQPCGTISPLACGAVPVALPFQLGWAASEGGIPAGSGGGTGFTVVQPHSNNFDPAVPSNGSLNGYEPAWLAVAGGLLSITTSRGIQYRDPSFSANTNSLVNGLGVGVDASSQALRIQTTLSNLPAGSNQSEQGGLSLWLDEDNLVKFVAINTGTNNYKFQLQVEDYPPTAPGFPATSTAPYELNTGNFAIAGSGAQLTLIVDPGTLSVTGYYDIGGGPVLIGSFPEAAPAPGTTNSCPGGVCPALGAEFFTGVDHDGNGGTPNVTFVGIFATQRNNTTITPRLVYGFDSFSVQTYCTMNSQCDDGNLCNGTETCSANTCVAGSPLVCNDGNVCTDDTCIPATGCSFPNNTAPCNDGNACTTSDTCSGGICVGGVAPNCDDANVCTDDSCNPGSGCEHVDNADPCSDGDICTTGDVCAGGSCQPGANTCPFGCEPVNTTEQDTQTKRTTIKYKGPLITARDTFKTKGAFVSATDPGITSEAVTVGMQDSVGDYYEATVPMGGFITTNGKTFKFKDKTKPYENNGLQSAKFVKKSDGQTYQYTFKSKELTYANGLPNGTGILAIKIGDRCFIDGSHACINSGSGKSSKCQ
jgi:hypothetical protein